MRSPVYLLKLFTRWALITLFISLLLFAASGTTRIPSLRNYLVTFSAFLLATMMAIDPGLANERSRPFENLAPSGRFAAGLSFLATVSFAALEVGRLHWFHPVPVEARWSSLLVFAVAMALQMWAMVVNPFFSADIRLQSDRGHRLITRGPYYSLRHPGYLAMLVSVPASALSIGSWLALVPAGAFCLAILKRVAKEEEFLHANLASYDDYMRRVPGRILPRISVHHRSRPSMSFQLPGRRRP